ncbi:MAG: hypothetical protein OXB88_02545 [Bacteriovoracales bacterium]|nr:hypothetical protein [Bacteriovoracales bacterium]
MRHDNTKDIYSKLPLSLIIPLVLAAVFLGFFLNFSLEEKILTFVHSQLNKNAPCPLKYDKTEVSYFLPGIRFDKMVIPSRCIGDFSKPLRLNYLNVQIAGFNFSTFSPVLSLKMESEENFIVNGKFTYKNKKEFDFHLTETQIKARFLSEVLDEFLKQNFLFKLSFNGDIGVNADYRKQKGKIHHIKLALKSNNIVISGIYALGVEIPNIDIGNFSVLIKTTKDGKKLILERISMGGANHSLTADIDGEIQLNQKKFLDSKILAKVKFKMAESFSKNDNISFLKMYLKKFYRPGDQFYHLELTNTLNDLDVK